jgi:hypothetical protein
MKQRALAHRQCKVMEGKKPLLHRQWLEVRAAIDSCIACYLQEAACRMFPGKNVPLFTVMEVDEFIARYADATGNEVRKDEWFDNVLCMLAHRTKKGVKA